MNKQRTLTELSNLEIFLSRNKIPFYTVIGHYRRWLLFATKQEEELVKQRILSLFGGEESLNSIFITLEPQDDELVRLEQNNRNQRLERMRESLYDALNQESQSGYDEDLPEIIQPVIIPQKKSLWDKIRRFF